MMSFSNSSGFERGAATNLKKTATLISKKTPLMWLR